MPKEKVLRANDALELKILDHFLANNNIAMGMAKLFWTFGLSEVVNGNGMMMVV